MVKNKKNRKNNNKNLNAIVRGLPRRFPSVPGDTMVVPFKFTSIVSIASGSSTFTALLVLGSGTSSAGYTFLNSVCSPFAGLYPVTTRWMISNLMVQVRATGVGGSSNTFIAASYIPSNTGIDSPPSGLAELSQAHHYCESSLGTVGNIRCNPATYFADWRQCKDDGDNSDSQCGLIQLYGSGTPGSEAVTAGVVTVSGVLYMCGQRI